MGALDPMKANTQISQSATPRRLHALRPGVSLGEVARGTNITMGHISRVFNAKRTPSLVTAKCIAHFLGVSLDRLFAILAMEEDELAAAGPSPVQPIRRHELSPARAVPRLTESHPRLPILKRVA